MSAAVETYVVNLIKKYQQDIKHLKRRGDDNYDMEELKKLEDDLRDQLDRYSGLTNGRNYQPSNDDIVHDFLDEYHYEVGIKHRTEEHISRFYDNEAVLNLVGVGIINTKELIVECIMAKYDGLALTHRIKTIAYDTTPRKNCTLHIDCTVTVEIESDSPRKVMQMFDLIKSSSATTYPWIITKEIYVVQDTRPLYHYPEFKLTTTTYDNWEPQFKPVNQSKLETKTQSSSDDPKTVTTINNNDTAVGVLRMMMNTIIEVDDDSSLADSASYDTHSVGINSIHTLNTKSGGDGDDKGDTRRLGDDNGKDDSHDDNGKDDSHDDNGGGNGDDRSHKTASDSRSVGSKSKDIVINAVSKDDNSLHSRHSNNNNNSNNNDNNILDDNDDDDGHDINDDLNHDDDNDGGDD